MDPAYIPVKPYTMGGDLTLNLGDGGQIVDRTRFRNRSRCPVLIDQITFRLKATTSAALGALLPTAMGGAVTASVSLGRTVITQVPIPIWLLRTQCTDAEIVSLSGGSGPASVFDYRVTWAFLYPLWMPPNSFLFPEFKYVGTLPATGQSDPTSVAITCRAKGRELPIDACPPKAVPVPYVCLFTPTPVAGGTAAAALPLSKQKDLFNPWFVPTEVDRYTGRIMFNQQEGDGGLISGNNCSPDTDVVITQQAGAAMVRDPTPFQHLFSQPTRAWRIQGARIPARSWQTVKLDVDYSAAAYTATAGTRVQPQIAMLGSRMVPYPELQNF